MAGYEDLLKAYFSFLDKKGQKFNVIVGILCTVLVGVLDLMTPVEYTFSLLYLFPVAFTTWFATKRQGLFVAVFCSMFWSLSNFRNIALPSAWNVLSTLGIFCAVSLMVSKIRQLLDSESILSRTDPLTGAMNIRALFEMVEHEILRHKRHRSQFSVACFDLDNFKKVNDMYGHQKGNELLIEVVTCLVKTIRRTDIVARMGGDEFFIFFPDTNLEAAKIVVTKATSNLADLAQSRNWPITLSMGVVTFTSWEHEVDYIISLADKLMYDVKKTGRNDVKYIEI
jgi:diguanylate cyclase (GGDEF) domain